MSAAASGLAGFTEAEKAFTGMQSGAVLFDRPLLTAIKVGGPDHPRYLQGRITQDLNQLETGRSIGSLLLSPQGKIQGKFLILKRESDLLLLAERLPDDANAEEFIRALLQFKVADQVDVESLGSSHRVLTLQGAASAGQLESIGCSVPNEQSHAASDWQGQSLTLAASQRGEIPGFDIICSNEAEAGLREVLIGAGAVLGSPDCWKMLRIESVLPEMGAELGEKTAATEIDVRTLVSFEKGCYAGQEVVEMSIARGRPNKSLVRLSGPAEAALPEGADIIDAASGKKCGSVTSSVFFPSREEAGCLGFIKAAFIESTAFTADGIELQRTSDVPAV